MSSMGVSPSFSCSPKLNENSLAGLSSLHPAIPASSTSYQWLHIIGSSEESDIANWFKQILFRRKAIAVGFIAAYSLVIYSIFVCLFQLNIVHPVQSFNDAVSILVSLRTYLYGLIFAIITVIYATFLARFVLRFDTEDRLPLVSLRSWLILAGSFNFNMLMSLCMFEGCNYPLNSQPRFIIFSASIATAVTCYCNLFQMNVRLVFPIIQMQFYRQLETVIFPVLKLSKTSLPISLKWTVICIFLIGLPFFGVATLFGNLLSPAFYFTTLLFLLLHSLLHNFTIRILKSLLLKKYEFSMPPPYIVLNSNPELKRTLIHALQSNDPYLKAFAYWDLRLLCVSSSTRRQTLFSLSQPGGHPRNWNSVKEACLSHIAYANHQFAVENDRYRTATLASVNPILPAMSSDRSAVLLQSNLRRENVRHRLLEKRTDMSTKYGQQREAVTHLNGYFRKLMTFIYGDHHILSSFDAYITILAVETLSSLIASSISEDHYGVVQRDLASIATAELELCSNLQKYMRSIKPKNTGKMAEICQLLVTAITTALMRLRTTFPDGTLSKRLNAHDADNFESLTQLSL